VNVSLALQRLAEGQPLSAQEAELAAGEIIRGEANPASLGALLMGLRLRGEDGPALTGFVKAMREASRALPRANGAEVVDTCGTGGDGRGSFNISTAAALLLASCGVGVAKHGNRSASGSTGSADVLEALGLPLDVAPERSAALLREHRFCFLFAPAYHPGMKHAGPVRRELGIRTIFNLCGPLSNPARPTHQLVGVSNPRFIAPIAEALAAIGVRGALVVHGAGGFDEITLTGESSGLRVHENGSITEWSITPEELGLTRTAEPDAPAMNPTESAAMMQRVLAGEPSHDADTVCANAAALLWLLGKHDSMRDAFAAAREHQRSGAAAKHFANILAAARAPMAGP
jgi:anthranilate phosphoribosyltransferase